MVTDSSSFVLMRKVVIVVPLSKGCGCQGVAGGNGGGDGRQVVKVV